LSSTKQICHPERSEGSAVVLHFALAFALASLSVIPKRKPVVQPHSPGAKGASSYQPRPSAWVGESDSNPRAESPAHPGEVLRDYLGEMTISEAASRLNITRAHLSRILNGHSSITAEMSLRLSSALGTSPDFWLRMQGQFDLWRASQSTKVKVTVFPHVAARESTAKRA